VHFTPETMAAMVAQVGGRVVRAQHRSKSRYIVRSVRQLVAARRDPPSRAVRAVLARGAARNLLRYVCEALLLFARVVGYGEAVRYYIRASARTD